MQTKEIFKQVMECFNNYDLECLLKLFSKDVNIWGTGTRGHINNIVEAREKFQAAWEIDKKQNVRSNVLIQSFIDNEENLYWQAAICKMIVTIGDEKRAFDNFRVTMIFKEEDGKTKIAHIHSSFPDFRIEEGTNYPTWEIF